MARLAGKVAFITGAGSGIGREAAMLFACEGARVVVAEIDAEAGAESARLVRDAGGEAVFVATDVTQPESVAQAIDAAVAAFGRLDILYNNAGGTSPSDGSVTNASLEAFWRTISVDLFGTWLVCRFGIPHLAAAGGGAIVNSSSMMGLIGQGKHAYTAAKGGVAALTRALAVEYAPQGIRANALAPGITLTDRVVRRSAEGAVPQGLRERHLLGPRPPIDVARTALFLASDESAGITGQIVSVDSGATIA